MPDAVVAAARASANNNNNNNNNTKPCHCGCTDAASASGERTGGVGIVGVGPNKIHYFGYGPIVHSLVRHRRGVPIADVQSAVLYDHRLVFDDDSSVDSGGSSSGSGLATVLADARGYNVYGVLLQFDTLAEWEAFAHFDRGMYHIQKKQVYSLQTDRQVTAYTMVMANTNNRTKKNSTTATSLPQERYLKLIAEGLQQLDGIPQDYIEDAILSVPYRPKTTATMMRKYRTFATAASSKEEADSKSSLLLKEISLRRYQRMCQKASSAAAAATTQKKSSSCCHHQQQVVYFVLGRKVLKLEPTAAAAAAQDKNTATTPIVQWIKSRFHGQPDMTLALHQTVVDPDIPMVDTQEDLTEQHYAWAEHHMVELLHVLLESAGGWTAKVVFLLQLQDNRGQQRRNYRPLFSSWFFFKKRNKRNSSSSSSLTTTRKEKVVSSSLCEEHNDEDMDASFSDCISDVALHHISRTFRQRRIQRELAAQLVAQQQEQQAQSQLSQEQQNSLEQHLLLPTDDTAATATCNFHESFQSGDYFDLESQNNEYADDGNDDAGFACDYKDDILQQIPLVIVRHEGSAAATRILGQQQQQHKGSNGVATTTMKTMMVDHEDVLCDEDDEDHEDDDYSVDLGGPRLSFQATTTTA